MIRALFKFAKLPDYVNGTKPVVIDTTSGSGEYRDLSPFILPAPPAKCFENLWQFSKVYKKHLTNDLGTDPHISNKWFDWRDAGYANTKAIRYPMGKGAIPEFTYWKDGMLGYIDARKQLYAPEYAKNVMTTTSFHRLEYAYQTCLELNKELILLDYDAYDHVALGMSLIDVINNPKRKMGHAFVLIMMLTDTLESCLI